MRLAAAILTTLTGTALVASLWFRALDQNAVVDAFTGAVYLFIALGLFGRSRFTLFLALAVPVASVIGVRWSGRELEGWLALRLALDAAIVACAGVALWQFSEEEDER